MSIDKLAPLLLGEGKTAQVYLLEKSDQKFAVKKFKQGVDISIREFEVKVMKDFDHPNIIAMVENQQHDNSIVFEYAQNGDIFGFVTAKPFSEKLARYYLVQLVNVLDYIHTLGVYHRDLKLENMFLDDKFILKVGDFGLAGTSSSWNSYEQSYISKTSITSTECSDTCSNDSTGYFQDFVGTEKYMAPEIIKKQKYSGEQTDMFAIGVILFNLLHGFCPYQNCAQDSDPFYRLLIEKRYLKYWAVFEKKTGITCSKEFKDLVNKLLEFEPDKRITLEEVKEHSWMHGEFPTEEEVFEQMQKRK